MADPFRGEICAAWLDCLSELEPEALQQVMQVVADGVYFTDDLSPEAAKVIERTREVYLVDLSYANHPMNYSPANLSDQPGAM